MEKVLSLLALPERRDRGDRAADLLGRRRHRSAEWIDLTLNHLRLTRHLRCALLDDARSEALGSVCGI